MFVRGLVLLALVAVAGCAGGKGREFYEVNKDRERMRKGQPLKYHKDPIELSQHAMDLRMGVRATKGKPSKGDLYGEGTGQPGAVLPASATSPVKSSIPGASPGGVVPAGGAYPGPYPAGVLGRTALE